MRYYKITHCFITDTVHLRIQETRTFEVSLLFLKSLHHYQITHPAIYEPLKNKQVLGLMNIIIRNNKIDHLYKTGGNFKHFRCLSFQYLKNMVSSRIK